MMFAVCDPSSGAVLRSGQCKAIDLAAQAASGQASVDISDIDAWTGDERDYWYDGTVVRLRAPLACTIPASVAVAAAEVITAPAGTSITVDGANVGVVDSSGSASISFSDAGTYAVTLSLWPALDVTVEVTAS